MIDVALLRHDPDVIRDTLRRRQVEGIDVDALITLDEERRRVRSQAEELRSRQKEAGKEIAGLSGADKEAAVASVAGLAEQYKALLAEADAVDARFDEWWQRLPNIPHESVPEGTTEEDAVEIKRSGDPPTRDFEPRDHIDLTFESGMIDMERAAKVSGSRFGILTGKVALLQMALMRWALDRLVAQGFTPVLPPVLAREEAFFGTGFFPDDSQQVYRIDADDLYLTGTSEVAIAAMHAGEILPANELPVRYAGFSTCFRRESGTYGKDTRGIFRVHQFDKVEMFSFCHPDVSWEEHEFLFAQEEALVGELGIPYRVVSVAAGDLGASAAKKLDIEGWFPGQGAYREITSCSNTTDFQARRLHIRTKEEKGNRLVHTLNGTAVTGRALIAILENYQQSDGTVAVPEVLRPYAGFDLIEG